MPTCWALGACDVHLLRFGIYSSLSRPALHRHRLHNIIIGIHCHRRAGEETRILEGIGLMLDAETSCQEVVGGWVGSRGVGWEGVG